MNPSKKVIQIQLVDSLFNLSNYSDCLTLVDIRLLYHSQYREIPIARYRSRNESFGTGYGCIISVNWDIGVTSTVIGKEGHQIYLNLVKSGVKTRHQWISDQIWETFPDSRALFRERNPLSAELIVVLRAATVGRMDFFPLAARRSV